MKQEIFGSRKNIFFLLFISMFVFQANFARADEWEDAGYSTYSAPMLKKNFSFSTPDEVRQFTTKYCKAGLALLEGKGHAYPGSFVSPPSNPNDDDGTHCYMFNGQIFQVLGENEGLYEDYEHRNKIFYVSFGKEGRATSFFTAIVTVKGSYKYQSNAGIQIVPRLKILRTAKRGENE